MAGTSATGTAERRKVAWEPQPKQRLALESPVFELFYGGAKGGGKSDFLLADFLQGIQEYGENHHGVIFRRTFPELEELLKRSREIYPVVGARWIGQSKEGSKLWKFPSGSTLKFRYLEHDKDVHSYQGHQYTWVGFDELTNWKSDYCYIYMFGCARSAAGIPVKIRASGNPGSVGHVWVKMRFIDPMSPYEIFRDPDTQLERVFIPARLEDNIILMEEDPGYENRLKAQPPHLYRAYRWGDWDIFAGQAFEEYRRQRNGVPWHVIRPIPVDPSWKRFASFDWGYARPYSIGWYAVTHEGRVYRYREMYGCEKGLHDVGVKKPASELAKESYEISVGEGCREMVADPSIWAKHDESPSIAEIFQSAGWTMIKANNDRISGLAKAHDYMKNTASDGKPMFICFETCPGWIRTIPNLVVDEKNLEDIDTDGEDHAYDEMRYALMSEFVRKVKTAQELPHDYHPVKRKEEEYDPLRWGLN